MIKNYAHQLLSLCALICFCNITAQTVTTFAGSSIGYADGFGTSARFNRPTGIAVGNDGTVYVADKDNNLIRKITIGGEVSTVAGSTVPGFVNGIGTAARFSEPSAIDVDASGILYVADTSNHAIRKIMPDGTVTTLAGSGIFGYADGTGSAAQFRLPSGIAVAPNGTVFVSEVFTNVIRKITQAGVVTTFAGAEPGGYADGQGNAALFDTPVGLTVAPDGTLYVVDKGNNRIRKITPSAYVSTLAGNSVAGFANGTGSAVQFTEAADITLTADGIIFIAEFGNHIIRRLTTTGTATTWAGSPSANTQGGYVDGDPATARFAAPAGIAAAPDGTLYIAEYGNSVIRRITAPLTNTGHVLENQVSIHPNPTNSLLHIDASNIDVSKIIVSDLNGRILNSASTIDYPTVMDISDLDKGMYLLQIITEKGVVSKKVIKE